MTNYEIIIRKQEIDGNGKYETGAEIYKQVVDDISLVNIINAVNKEDRETEAKEKVKREAVWDIPLQEAGPDDPRIYYK